MGLFKAIKSALEGGKYRINREILIQYVKESIQLSIEEELPFCDEFSLCAGENSEKMHFIILNYDAPCENELECEENLHGIIIFVVRGKLYNPNKDERFYSIEEVVDFKLVDFPEWFLMCDMPGEPAGWEKYRV